MTKAQLAGLAQPRHVRENTVDKIEEEFKTITTNTPAAGQSKNLNEIIVPAQMPGSALSSSRRLIDKADAHDMSLEKSQVQAPSKPVIKITADN